MKRATQKTVEATGDLIGNKIGNKITKERYISPEERQHVMDELRLI